MTALPDPVFDGVVDVSHWNGTIAWRTVAAAGIALAFAKASEGGGSADPLYAKNRAEAVAAGILVVPYHFIDAAVAGSVQAAHFLKVAGIGAGDAAMLDWETPAPVETVLEIGNAVARATGRDPVTYYGWAQLAKPDPILSGWPLMLPEYPQDNRSGDYASLVTAPPRLPPGRRGSRPYDFHQYTMAGTVAGITGHVDRSIWVGTEAQLRAWHASGALPAE